LHRALSCSATGTHTSAVIASVRGQYTCTPRTELAIVGRGSFAHLQKSSGAEIAVCWSGVALGIGKDLN
jgi:hypothetical protein